MTHLVRVPIRNFGRVVTGKTPSSDVAGEYGYEVPFLTPSDLGSADKFPQTERFLSEQGRDRLKRILIPPKSVSVVCIGATIGKVGFTTAPSVTNQQINTVVVDRERHSPEFVYYLFSTLRPWLQNYAGGAATPIVNKSAFSAIEPPVPSSKIEQRKIAAVLTAYDDLIENNRQHIALLEKMAEEIYREWFVRLRFPVHEQTPVHKGVPEGADVSKLRTHVGYYIGGGWGSENPTGRENQPVYVIRGTDFETIFAGDVTTVPLRYEKFSSIESRKLQPGDIVMENSVNHASRTAGRSILITEGILKLFDGDVICASFCKLLRPRRASHAKMLHLNFKLVFEQGLFEIYQNIATNGIANLQIERFLDRHLVMIPPNVDVETFGTFDSSAITQMQSHLRSTRDLLLNRLISGKLRVDDLDIQFPPSMQDAT